MRDNPRDPGLNEDSGSEGVRYPGEMEMIYGELLKTGGMRLMAYLVEANVVLSIAGVRPQTEFFINNPTALDHDSVEKLRQFGENNGLEIQDLGEDIAASDGRKILMVSVENMNALERVSREVPLNDFPHYSAKTGTEGARRWTQRAHSAIEHAIARAELPQNIQAGDFLAGIEKGYPFIAVIDACIGYARDKLGHGMVSTHLPSAGLYGGALPEFDYAPEHENHPDIVHTVQQWEKVLRDFYDTSWHKSLAENQEFILERKKRREKY